MKTFSLITRIAALAVSAGFAFPAAAQTTWNYGSTCAVTNGYSSTCTPSAGNTLITQGWAATAGSTYVQATLTNQGSLGTGMTAPGETTAAPDHAIDNNGMQELVLLNFGSNKVVLSSIATGYSNTDSDVSILRWTGAAAGPTMSTTQSFGSMTSAQLVAAGWALVASADVDGVATSPGTDLGGGTMSTGLGASTANSSAWWIVSSYFGATTGNLDTGNDYFKLLSVTTTSCSSGGTLTGSCSNITVPEPTSLALAGLAVVGAIGTTRRRRKTA